MATALINFDRGRLRVVFLLLSLPLRDIRIPFLVNDVSSPDPYTETTLETRQMLCTNQ